LGCFLMKNAGKFVRVRGGGGTKGST